MIRANCQEYYLAKAILEKYNLDLLADNTKSTFVYECVIEDDNEHTSFATGSIDIEHLKDPENNVISVFDFEIKINLDDYKVITIKVEQTDEMEA